MKKRIYHAAAILLAVLTAGLLYTGLPVHTEMTAADEVVQDAEKQKEPESTEQETAAKSVKKGKTGWVKKGTDRYYLVNGTKVTGWKKIKGAKYYFKKNGKMVRETVKINGRLEVFHTNGKWINTASMDKKAKKLKSSTDYLILVSLDKRVTKIYKGSKGNWTPVKNILSTVGNPKKGWDTVKGTFYVGYSSWNNPTTRGYSFEDSDGHTLYYWTRFCDSFLFHSQLYENNSMTLTAKSNGLGKELSHGCVRMNINNAKWIYKHVPDGSKVVVY